MTTDDNHYDTIKTSQNTLLVPHAVTTQFHTVNPSTHFLVATAA